MKLIQKIKDYFKKREAIKTFHKESVVKYNGEIWYKRSFWWGRNIGNFISLVNLKGEKLEFSVDEKDSMGEKTRFEKITDNEINEFLVSLLRKSKTITYKTLLFVDVKNIGYSIIKDGKRIITKSIDDPDNHLPFFN